MVFSSNIFLFVFLPLFLGVYYITPNRFRSFTILIGSYVFYAWWRLDFLGLFVGVTFWNYWFGVSIGEAAGLARRRFLILGLTGNLVTLGYFKYANFGVNAFNSLLVAMGGQEVYLVQVILPIGISFYIFQAISYLIDVYRRDCQATRNFVDFAAFIALFPQLIAGPVLRYKDIVGQFECRSHTVAKVSEGCTRFMKGFIKKVFIADSLAVVADTSFRLSDPSAADAWIGAFAYTAQLYFDFSGYCDMAVGLGLMMGFRFVENFNQPYISQSITEFWRRWHISLSNWLRDYLYIPLGGNRKGTLLTYRNLFFTMVLGGLWHGANWTFVVWGVWHGGLLALERYFGLAVIARVSSDVVPNSFSVFRWSITFLLVMAGWVIFRSDSLGDAYVIFRAMSIGGWSVSDEVRQNLDRLTIFVLFVAYGIILFRGFCSLYPQLSNRGQWFGGLSRVFLGFKAALPLVFVLSIFKLTAGSFSPFLYFQF